MKSLFITAFCFLSLLGFSQTPTMSWQKTIGGSDVDGGNAILQLANGNFIVCAASFSGVSGDKTVNGFGGSDYWIYEISSNGIIAWQKVYGGSNDDSPTSIVSTSDGGFIVLGVSKSSISGNKSSTNFGETDLWAIKIKADGSEEWQKSFGGDSSENVGGQILELSDGSFVISVTSSSGISGNKTIASKGGSDYWVLHIDGLGLILNQFGVGGSNNDFLVSVLEYADSRLLLSGYSDSDLSGDKQENSFGSLDFWVLKTDLNGNVMKSATIGGNSTDFNSDCVVLSNGDLVLFGYSSSPPSGNKSSGNNGMEDYWVVNLDSNLNVKWDANFGGSSEEITTLNSGLFFAPTNSIILGGTSWSDVSGNKTLPSFGDKDIWIVGLDTLGSKEFEFVAGGNNDDFCGQLIQSSGSTVVVIGSSRSGISGNKTENLRGIVDVWQFELDFNVGIEKMYSNNELNAFPVPTSTVLNFAIPMKGTVSSISLTDITGKVVYSSVNSFGDDEQINVSNFLSGIYILNVISDKFQYTRAIVIE